MFDREKLFCYGCAHSASQAHFPGMPSGERPCCFCIRNKEFMKMLAKQGEPCPRDMSYNERMDKNLVPIIDCWYDGTPAVKIPMDCYHTIDMKNTISEWEDDFRKVGKSLAKYFGENYDKNIIDHSVRVYRGENDRFDFYIHADGQDSVTLDFTIDKNFKLKKKGC